MPGRDRSGPLGQGPMTGRGMGFWGGEGVAGRGRGGSGRGWRRRNVWRATGLTSRQRTAMAAPAPAAEDDSAVAVAAADSEQELAMLRQQADGLAAALEDIRKRIDEIQDRRLVPESVAAQAEG